MVESSADLIIKAKESKSLCSLPWVHLATHPIGTVTPCCLTDMTDGMSTSSTDYDDRVHYFLGKDSLETIANSTKFKNLRKEMINGTFPKMCQKCYRYEDAGIESKRKEANEQYGKYLDEFISGTKPDGEITKLDYRYIELRLGAVCNLKCVTCNPFSSNRWNQDVHVFKGTDFEKDYFNNEIKTEWYRDLNFYDELLSKSKNLEEIWINGGEPTLIKEHGYFLQKLIDNDQSKNIKLHYSLNSTKFPDSFIQMWEKFKKVRIQISIDDIEDRNYYVRFPSDWNVIMSAFNKIVKYKDIFDLEICQTVSALNVYNLAKFKEYFDKHHLPISHNYVHYPTHLQVNILPEELKKEVLNVNKDLADFEINKLVTELNKPLEKTAYSRFISYINLLDRAREVKIYEYLPEWKFIFDR